MKLNRHFEYSLNTNNLYKYLGGKHTYRQFAWTGFRFTVRKNIRSKKWVWKFPGKSWTIDINQCSEKWWRVIV